MLRLLADARYRPFFISFVSGSFAEGLIAVVVPFAVLAVTEDPVAVGICLGAQTAGVLVVAAPAASLADRYPREKVISVAYWLATAALAGLLFALMLGGAVWSFAALLFLFGSATAVYGPASDALTPRLVKKADLHRANAMDGLAQRLGQGIFGPLIGGVLVATGLATSAFAGAALLCVLASLTVLRAKPTSPPEDAAGPAPGSQQSWAAVRRYLWSSPLLVVLLVWVSVSIMLTVGAKPVAATSWAGTFEDGAVVYGAALALGSGVSAIVVLVVGSRGLPRRYIECMVAAWSVGAGVLLAAVAIPAWWGLLVAYGLSAGMMAVGNIYWSTYVQSTVPDRLLTKVISIDWVASLALTPLGAAGAGFAVSAWGAAPVLLVIAVVPLVTGAALLTVLLVRRTITAPIYEAPTVANSAEPVVAERTPVGDDPS